MGRLSADVIGRCSKAIVTATGSASQLGSARHAGGESLMYRSGGSPVAEERLGIPAQPGVSKGENQHGSTRNEDDVHLLSFTVECCREQFPPDC